MAEEKNNSYKFRGKVVEMPAAKTGVSVAGEWMVQTIVVEEPEFKKRYSFEIFGKDKCEKFDLHINEDIILYFNLVSSQFNGRYYTTCRVWKVVKSTFNDSSNLQSPPPPIEVKKHVEDNPITDVNQLPF